jgi:hypothetical protein
MVRGIPHWVHTGNESPHNKCLYVRHVYPIQRHVSITSSFLVELKEECHIPTEDSFTVPIFYPVYWYIHLSKKRRQNEKISVNITV